MEDIVLPPKTPKPQPPIRKYKVKSVPKVLKTVLGQAPCWRGYLENNRWVRNNNLRSSITLKKFCDELMLSAKRAGLDPDITFVSAGGAHNSVKIEQYVHTESEDDFEKRYREYESEIEKHARWDALPAAEKRRILLDIKRLEKLARLQKKKDELKVELNELVSEIEHTARTA